jgi:hypothetical protein
MPPRPWPSTTTASSAVPSIRRRTGRPTTHRKVAEKYRGKTTGEARLIKQIASGEKAKFPDGQAEVNRIVESSPPKDMEQIRNLVH